MKPTLRPYQEDLIQKLRDSVLNGNRRILAVLPTGGGKTFTFSFMVKNAWDRGRKCLILTDRVELLTQAGGALKSVGIEPIPIKSGFKPYLGGRIYSGMVETIARRISSRKDYQHWLKNMDLIIVDEAHKRSFTKLFPYVSEKARVFGFTATPERMGKKDQLAETYTDLCVGVEIEYLVDNGYLAKPKYYGVEADLSGVKTKAGDYDQNEVASRFSASKLYKGVVENWRERTPNTKTLVFSSNIENSIELRDEMIREGLNARHLDSKMKKSERESVLFWFKNTPKAILCNVGILTTGFDEPSIETIVLYRATKSLPLYLQMVGRGSRVTPSKSSFNILDFGNNILEHGFWHEKRDWGLALKEIRNKPKGEQALKSCKKCEGFIPARAIVCEFCGYVYEQEKKEQEFARLQLLDPNRVWNESQEKTLEERVELCKRKLIKPYRVLHNLKDFDDVKKFISLMGWNPYWMQHNHDRFWWSAIFQEELKNGKQIMKILESA